MKQEDKKPITFKIKTWDGLETVTFRSSAEIRKWLDRQLDFWKKMMGGESEKLPSPVSVAAYHALSDQINRDYNDASQSKAAFRLWTHPFQNELKRGLLPFQVPSTAASFILDCYDKDPYVAIIGIQILAGGEEHLSSTYPAKALTKATFLTGQFMEGQWTPDSPKVRSYAQTLKAIQNNYSKAIAQAERDTLDQISLMKSAENFTIEQSHKQRKVARRRTARQIVKTARGGNKAIEEINLTKKAYLEDMQMRASVEYWTYKAGEHRTQEGTYLMIVTYYALICFMVLLAVLVGTFNNVEFFDMKHSSQFTLIVSGLILTITTLAIWVGRVLTRLYLSEKHLRTDAEERSVMVKTYLALLNEGAADQSERALVLAPLFRPTEDGLVKDDAAPFIDVIKLLKPK
ncbi:MAG: DUF6161 domain-containing protein [Alphaproteobacteria bacterium]